MINITNLNDCDSSTESELGHELDHKVRAYSSGRNLKSKSQIDLKVVQDYEKISNQCILILK
jgi:hypothetical protein